MAFAYYTPFTIATGQVSGTPGDMPVVILPTDNRFRTIANGGHVANANGYDLRPYSDTVPSTSYTYELVSGTFNATTGFFEMWIKRTSIADGQVAYMFYGDASLNTDGSSASTWPSGCQGVFHFPNGSSLTVADSTAAGISLSQHATPTAAIGKVDGGANFVAASSQYMNATGLSALNTTTRSLLAWIKPASFPGAYNTPIGIGGDQHFFDIHVKSSGKLAMYTKVSSDVTVSYDGTGSHTLSADTFYRVAMTFVATPGLTGYVNGSSDGTGSSSDTLKLGGSDWELSIGTNSPNFVSRYWDGVVDEVQIWDSALSANWITTEYNNQVAPNTFWTMGSEVAVGGGSPTYVQLERGIRGLTRGLAWVA